MSSLLLNRKIKKLGFMRLPEVLEFLHISKASWWNGIAKGHYPEGVKISMGCTAWRVEDIRNLAVTEPVLSVAEVLEMIPVKRSTWYLGVRDGRYPKPILVPGKRTKWKLSDIEKLIETLSNQ